MTTESVSLNPMGLVLAQMLEVALMPTIKSLVAEAMAEAQTGKLAGVMLDSEFSNRVVDAVRTLFISDSDYLLRDEIDDLMDSKLQAREIDDDHVNSLIDSKLNDHTSDYDHDEFQTKDEVKELIEEALEDADVTPVDADNDDFRSAVCAAVRNSLG